MIIELFNIIAPVFICAAIGFGWAKSGVAYEIGFITRLVTNIGFPCLIFAALVKVELDLATFGDMALASALSVIAFAMIAAPLLRLFKLDMRAFMPAMMFANTGNIGLPLCLLAFGEQGLALAIPYFTVNALLVFILGPAIAAGSANPLEVLKVPLVWSVLAALAVMFTGVEVPGFALKTIDLLGGFAIPLMLITLGVSLAGLRVNSLPRSVALAALRLAMGFAVGWGLAEGMGFEGAARGVLIIECAMPVAVFNYLYAQRYDTSPDEVAGAVLVSTAMSFVTLPALLWYVLI